MICLTSLLEEAYRVKARCIGILEEQGLVAMSALLGRVEIKWSTDLTVTAGMAYRSGMVLLSASIFARPENSHDFDDTVAHELAHVATPKHGHDELWKHVAQMFGSSGRKYHSLNINRGGHGRWCYPLRCDCCHATVYVQKKNYRVSERCFHKTDDGQLSKFDLVTTAKIMQANRLKGQLERLELDVAVGEAHAQGNRNRARGEPSRCSYHLDASVKERVEKVCSWCPDSEGETERLLARGFEVTHIMCDECQKEYLS